MLKSITMQIKPQTNKVKTSLQLSKTKAGMFNDFPVKKMLCYGM